MHIPWKKAVKNIFTSKYKLYTPLRKRKPQIFEQIYRVIRLIEFEF